MRKKINIKNTSFYSICFLIFFSIIIRLPTNPIGNNLDQSWGAVLHYAFKQKLQFGKEIIFTYGPLGLMSTESFIYETLIPNIITFNFIFYFLISLIFIYLLSSFKLKKEAFLYFLTMIYFTAISSQDLIFSITLIILTFFVTKVNLKEKKSYIFTYIFNLILVVLVLIKGSFILISPLLIIFLFIKLLKEKLYPLFFKNLIFTISSLLFIWILLEQKLNNLLRYFHYSWSLSKSYTPAMSIRESNQALILFIITITTIVLMFFFSIYLKNGLNKLKNNWKYFLTLSFLHLFLIFQHWKHGVVRADRGHVSIMIFFFLIYGFNIFFFLIPRLYKKISSIFLIFLLVISSYSLKINSIESNFNILAIPSKAFKNWSFLTGLNSKNLDLNHENEDDNSFLEVKNIVGSKTIDVFGYNQAELIRAEFNYSPRPIFHSYTAYNNLLTEINYQHIISDKNPDYVLYYFESIDNRYPFQDDFKSILELINNYELVYEGKNYLLFHKNIKRKDSNLNLIDCGTIFFEEVLRFPETTDYKTISLKFEKNIFGQFLEIFYKNSNISAEVEFLNGEKEIIKILSNIPKQEFLIDPFFENTHEIKNWMTNSSGKRIKSIRFYQDSKLSGYVNKINYTIKNIDIKK